MQPSSIICYPEEKTFYATINSSGKTLGSALCIIDFEEAEQNCKLTHRSLPYSQQLSKCMFLKDAGVLLSTSSNGGQSSGLAVYSPQTKEIKPMKTFTEGYSNVMTTKDGQILLAGGKQILKYDVEKDALSAVLPLDGPCLSYVSPNNSNILLCGYLRENRIGIYDRQSKTPAIRIENAHSSKPLSFDFNPSKPNYFMACYHDCLKFWDLKKPNLPMKCVDLHHSMLLSAKYNFYDELVLASYDDGTLGLFRMTSISSAATSVSGSSKEEDGLVKLYDQHEDSTYQICWASFSPWYFASISYGSNMVVNSVPSSEKHRILF